MINYINYDPVVFAVNGTLTRDNINRTQDMSFTTGLNREKVKELGTDGTVGWITGTPDVSGSIRQYENGELDFYKMLANSTSSVVSLTQNDFKTSAVDILAYQTDDDDAFVGTAYYPNLRTAGFSMSIADPEATLERNISLVGEDSIVFANDNKYVIELAKTVVSGEAGSLDIVIGSGDYSTYPDPVLDPDTSATYIIRGTRVRAGVSSDLTEGTEFTYTHGSTTITIASAEVDDVYKFVYTATTYISGSAPFTSVSPSGTDDLAAIQADSVSIYLTNTSNYLYRLQSVGVDVAFDRFDQSEIGNKEVVLRGTRETNVTITLGRTLEDYTIESLLRGVASTYGKIDAREFATDLTLIIKIYSDNTKSNFKMGYRFTNLSPTNTDDSDTIDDYVQRGVTLGGEEFTISTSEAVINGS